MATKRVLKLAGKGVLVVAAFVASTLAFGIVNTLNAQQQLTAAPRPFVAPEMAPPPHDPARPTVAVLASNNGTEISDLLAPYAVFAAADAFNVYTVAPQRTFTPFMWGGVDLLPHYSFAELDARLGRNPDVIVVPFIKDRDNPEIIEWIRSHAGPETLVVSICGGAYVLAATGLVDDGQVTTHGSVLPLIAKKFPHIELVPGVRYTDNGSTITSAGITAGIDASLYTIKKLLGLEAAMAVAQKLRYPHTHFLEDPSYPVPHPGVDQYAVPLSYGFTRGQPLLGVYLPAGVDEIDLTAMLDSYGRTFTAYTNTFAPERTVVRTRHNLYLVPRDDFASLPPVARILSPAREPGAATAEVEAWAQESAGKAVEHLYVTDAAGAGAYAFDVMLADVARHMSTADARAAAWTLEYPTEHRPLPQTGWPVARLLMPVAVGLLGVAALALMVRGARMGIAALRRPGQLARALAR